ncbi:MAG: hypothetical protein ACMUIU_19025 [bacterium]
MKNNDSSLLEVWEWKNKVYQDIKDLTAENYINIIKKNTDKFLLENDIKLTSIILEKEPQKI